MFQFGRLPSYTYVFSIWYTSSSCMDCSIRKSTYHSVLTAPRGLSQLITSFFGSQCQGIRPALFLALPFVSCFWVLLIVNQYTSCSFTQQYFLLSFYTRSILICITFALFCFQVSFCSWEQISVILFQITQIHFQDLVGTNGLEPSTSRLSGVRSNHLSYAPSLVEMRRIELLTLCVQGRCSPSWATPPFSAPSKSNNAPSNFSWLTRVNHSHGFSP